MHASAALPSGFALYDFYLFFALTGGTHDPPLSDGNRLVGLPAGLCTARDRAGALDFDSNPGNLPKSVVPSRYALSLDLDPASDSFTGRADIAIEVRQTVRAVVLHARNLQASRIELRQGDHTRSLQLSPGPIQQGWSLEPRNRS